MNAILATENQPSLTLRAAPVKVKADRVTRDEWDQEQSAEQALAAQQRRIRETSYLPEPADRFYIH